MKHEHHTITAYSMALCFALVACRQVCICPASKETVKEVVVKDTAEVSGLKKENKELRREIYWRKQNGYKLKARIDSVVQVKEAPKESTVIMPPQNFLQFNPDTYPCSFEYNARTDPYPPKGNGTKYSVIRNADNEAWGKLPHRASEDELFKPK